MKRELCSSLVCFEGLLGSGNKIEPFKAKKKTPQQRMNLVLSSKEEKYMLLRLHYVSKSASGFITPQTRESILQVAVPMNQKFSITGVLICLKNMFFQIIEGAFGED